MSHLLEVMRPFRENMNRFINLYRKVNNILQRVTAGFGYRVTQEAYFRAAEEARYRPVPAEDLLKKDFVDICKKLTSDRNQPGSIPHMLHIMDDVDQFTFFTEHVGDATYYELLQSDFKSGISGLKEALDDFLEHVKPDEPDLDVFTAPGDVVPEDVQNAIDYYHEFIAFLQTAADHENLETTAGGRRTRIRFKKNKKGRRVKTKKKRGRKGTRCIKKTGNYKKKKKG